MGLGFVLEVRFEVRDSVSSVRLVTVDYCQGEEWHLGVGLGLTSTG